MEKKTLYEAQKNYLVCAILMFIVGVLMFPMGKTNWGIGCIVVGVGFLVGFFVLLKKMGLCVVYEDENDAPKKAEEKAAEEGASDEEAAVKNIVKDLEEDKDGVL